MAVFNKFNSFVEALAEKVHNLGADQLTLALCAAANAPLNTNTKLADLVQINYANCSARALTTGSSAQAGGLYTLVVGDLTLMASGGNVGPFRYIVVYNDTALNDELIGFYDIGSEVTLTDGQSFTCDFDGVNGMLQLQ